MGPTIGSKTRSISDFRLFSLESLVELSFVQPIQSKCTDEMLINHVSVLILDSMTRILNCSNHPSVASFIMLLSRLYTYVAHSVAARLLMISEITTL